MGGINFKFSFLGGSTMYAAMTSFAEQSAKIAPGVAVFYYFANGNNKFQNGIQSKAYYQATACDESGFYLVEDKPSA